MSVTNGTYDTQIRWGVIGAESVTLKRTFFMCTDIVDAVEGLLRWWHNRYGIVLGNRNANIYKLAAAFNNYGIPYADALSVCLRYVDNSGRDPFTSNEITNTVTSAYRRTEHATKQWNQRAQRTTQQEKFMRTLSEAQAQAIEDRIVEHYMKLSKQPPRIENTSSNDRA